MMELALLIGAAIMLIVAIASTVMLSSWHVRNVRRLPMVAEAQTFEVNLGSLRQQCADLELKKETLDKAVTERSMIAGEVNALEDKRDALTLELLGQDDARLEVEALKAEIARAIEEKGAAEQALDDIRHAAESGARDAAEALRVKQEAQQLAAQAEARAQELDRSLVDKRAELTGLATELDQARAARVEREAEERRLQELTDRHAAIMAQIDKDEARLDDFAQRSAAALVETQRLEAGAAEARDALNAARQAHDAALTRKLELDAETQALLARKAALGDLTPSGAKAADADPAGDLLTAPACLAAPHLEGPRPQVLETEALHQVDTSLRARGLTFPTRTIRAFHTALKIGETSPMTVLAGISGTGKSQLPRRYAEAMGIHFLQIAVQPRWDSPQDLLGFYNFVEERYHATELAKAMVHLDAKNWPDQAAPYEDRMMLVLLDEMNLARVEYYFSEFLSRLESRPSANEPITEENWDVAKIDFEFKRKDGNRVPPVYPGHNLLFVGTMNEDESTQSLSDKVLDRSNQMHFSRPASFAKTGPATAIELPRGHLTRATWQGWIKPADALAPASAERCGKIIQSLSDISNACGRAFGHRMNQAILAYVANYPREGDDVTAVNHALVDQIEMRILPKLARVEIDTHESDLKKLADLVRDELGDGNLAGDITSTIERSRASSMFAWHGRGASD